MLLHGFTQTRRCWGPFADLLAARHELLLVDAPGHGDSAGVEADVAEGAALLGATGGRAGYLGYSMGGRHALRLALDRPDLVERLVLLGTSPGLRDEGERRARARRDDELAARLERIGVDAFLDEWLAQPLFRDLSPDAACLDERRRNTAEGLAASLRRAGTGHQAPLWSRLGELRAPTLLLAGETDEVYCRVARAMAEAVGPLATVEVVPRAGHAVHLERPVETARAVLGWLEATAAQAPT